MTQDTCLFDVMTLPEEQLRKVLPKVSVQLLMRLITAYPRAIGRTLSVLLSDNLSPQTLEFFRDEMEHARPPSIHQIREAERELIKALHEEELPIPQSITH